MVNTTNGSLRSPFVVFTLHPSDAPLGKVQDEGVRFGGLVAVDEVKEVDGRGRVGLGEGQWEWGRSCGGGIVWWRKLGWIWGWFLWLLGLAAFCLDCWVGEGEEYDDGEEEEEEEGAGAAAAAMASSTAFTALFTLSSTASGCRSGRRRMNSVPSPGAELTSMTPPCCSMIW